MKRQETLHRHAAKEIERFLKEKYAKLKEIVSAVSQRCTSGIDRSADSATWATETLHYEMDVTLSDRLYRQLSQIEDALDRLARNEYGICDDCGEFIGLARLRALPFAQRCSPCQSRTEAQERRVWRPVLEPVFSGAGDE